MTLEQVIAAPASQIVPTTTPREPTSSPQVKVPVTSPEGLTPREMDVLRRVAQGLTDAQVAEKLVISPYTVNTHLKAIYGKIRVSSRSATTRYAMEHQLL